SCAATAGRSGRWRATWTPRSTACGVPARTTCGSSAEIRGKGAPPPTTWCCTGAAGRRGPPRPPPARAPPFQGGGRAGGGGEVGGGGEGGALGRRAGGAWEDRRLPTSSSITTVHGCGANDVWAVVGQSVWHYDGAWTSVHDTLSIANGVACGAAGVLVV